jgi:predicted nucleic acid-binding protein
VLAAYYCQEQLSAAVGVVLGDISAPTLGSLVEIELCYAVSLKVRARDLDMPSARTIISQFRADIADGLYNLVDIEPREYVLARDWLSEWSSSLSTLDALHVAAAFSNNLELITADKTMMTAARHFSVRCRLVIK